MKNIVVSNDKFKKLSGQVDGYTTESLNGYLHFKESYEIIAINLCKEKVLDADPKTVHLNLCIVIVEVESCICKPTD